MRARCHLLGRAVSKVSRDLGPPMRCHLLFAVHLEQMLESLLFLLSPQAIERDGLVRVIRSTTYQLSGLSIRATRVSECRAMVRSCRLLMCRSHDEEMLYVPVGRQSPSYRCCWHLRWRSNHRRHSAASKDLLMSFRAIDQSRPSDSQPSCWCSSRRHCWCQQLHQEPTPNCAARYATRACRTCQSRSLVPRRYAVE